MTLHIIHSNKVERLHDELCYLLQKQPLSNPFELETIVCPSQAMARWINIRFTQKMGIAARYDYPMPSSWVWQLAAQCLDNVPNQDPLQRDVLTWHVFFWLGNINNEATLSSIKHYLHNDSDTTKRWSLAKKIASVFERYQHYRPDFIEQWNAGKVDDWQGELWQQLSQTLETDRVRLLNELGQWLYKKCDPHVLPKRVSFFSVSALPPLLLKNIQALATQCEVYFFVLSPSPHYWSDLISLKQHAKQRLKAPELSDYFSTGHELLASWGRQGQVFQDLLLNELDDATTDYHEVYDECFSPSLLNQLQQSLFHLNDNEHSIKLDDSIKINQCHSPLRECEVLHDQCLDLLQNPALSPEDILVIVPNMALYAVSIEAVFKKTSDQHLVKPFIPWNLSDGSLQAENPVVDTFLNVFALPSSRFTSSNIMAFLDCPLILQRFNLVEADKNTIREYIHSAHVNWGFDAAHKADLNVPKTLQNTWHQAQQRFFSAYALNEPSEGDDTALLKGFSSSRSIIIAQFIHFLDCLNYWRLKLHYARSLAQWQSDINQLMEAMFGLGEDSSVQLIRDVIDDMVTNAHNPFGNEPTISRELVQKYLGEQFDNAQHNQRFFTGGITFCGMRPMRSVPFKVIVMLGMNEHDFPRHNSPVEFDLMASSWRQGDLLISDEDRYLFLEAILCARQTLIISYCASSLKDNSVKEPSHLVSELCDYLDSHFMTDNADEQPISQQIATHFAMHSFSGKNYGELYQSYNRYWADVAQQLSGVKQQQSSEALCLTSYKNAATIELKRLVQCLKDPLSFYFKTQLNISLFEEQDTQDDELFDLNALQKWNLKNQLINAQLQQHEISVEQLKAQALMPHGRQAQVVFDDLQHEVEERLNAVEDYLKQSSSSINIDLDLANGVQLQGQVPHYYVGLGLLSVTPSNFGAKPFISSWLQHCALCASQGLSQQEHSVLLFNDKSILFPYLTTEDAQAYLIEAIELMQLAEQAPLLLLPKTSFAYQYQLNMGDEQKAHKEALAKWHGNPNNEAAKGEKEQDVVVLSCQDFLDDPESLLSSDDFKNNARRLYSAAFNACNIEAV